MIFYREVGAILNSSKQILSIQEGSATLVQFSAEQIWQFHKDFKGETLYLSHVHPDGMTMLSHEDETTLKAWCVGIFPHPLRMITITHMRSDSFTKEHVFRETCYIGILEAKETWLLHKDQPRKFEIIKEWERDFFIEDPQKAMNDWYGLVLIRKSYQWEDKMVN